MTGVQLTGVEKKIICSIYQDFFKGRNKTHLDVFLCGKGNAGGKKYTIRDDLKNRFSTDGRVRILYPEDLFVDFFNKNKKYNMLEMEKFLAENSDIICIICEESPGALVELGAFTNNSNTLPKVVALIRETHKRDKSFIMLGPVRCIQQQDNGKGKANVLFFSDNIDELHTELDKVFHARIRSLRASTQKDLDTLIGQYYFVTLILYYFKILTAEKLVLYIKSIAEIESITISDFDLLFNAVLKLMYRERLIEKSSLDDRDAYSLSEKGISFYYQLFYNTNKSNKTILSDKISLSILSSQYY